MSEEVDLYLEDAADSMAKAIDHLEKQLAKMRAGRANPQMLDAVMVDYYGSEMAIPKVANITASDLRTIVIQPWEKKMLEPIERAILKANLGITPQSNGEVIRLMVPMLTEERRRDLVKQVKAEGEHARVSLRTTRKETNEELKKLQKDGVSEDEVKDAEDKVQKITDKFSLKIDEILARKEKDIMTV